MAKKKRGAHGGHGWFVTFADLMALLMSFFVMVAAYSSQDQTKMKLVSGSMRDAFGTSKDTRFSGIIEKDGVPTKSHLHNARDVPPQEAADHTTPYEHKRHQDGEIVVAFARGFGLAAASVRQAFQDMPEIAELSKNIVVAEARHGLDISIVDQDGRAMFPDGGAYPHDHTRDLLNRLAPMLRRMPNRIAVTGHTATTRPGHHPGAPWELTRARAANVREILASSGLPDDRFAAVIGKAAVDPLFPDNPHLAPNRRVTITLLREAAPLPDRPL